jgi:hypothetical protein
MARAVALARVLARPGARKRWLEWWLSAQPAQSSKRELLSRGRAPAEGPPVFGPGFGGVMGLKSASLMLVLLRESGLRKSGFLESLGAVPGRFPRIGVPWGMLPAVRGEAGSPIGLEPGSLVALPGPLAPPGPRRLERGMPSGLAMGRLPRRASGPSSRSRRRAPKSLAGLALPWPPALKRLRSAVLQSSWAAGRRLSARSGIATRLLRLGR